MVTADKLPDTFVKNRIKSAETALVAKAKRNESDEDSQSRQRQPNPVISSPEWTV